MKTGIYVPLVTPYKENFEIDYDCLARATKFVLEKGADGIYALGGTSEFNLLSVEERKRCLEVIIANAGGKEVIAHVGSQSTLDSLELARHAYSVGANMISAVAPYYFAYTFAQVKEYFTTLAHATALPLMIYSSAQARSYTASELDELLSDEKITAIKYTGFDFYTLERIINDNPTKKFYSGADEAFLSGQVVGADGAIGTTYNYFADKYIEVRRLFLEGKNKEALAIFHKINDITHYLVLSGALMPLTKYIMKMQGLDILPLSRPPFSKPSQKMLDEVKSLYEKTKF